MSKKSLTPLSDEIIRNFVQAHDAIFTVDPEDPAVLDAHLQRCGDACEAMGLPRNYFWDDGIPLVHVSDLLS
jgi:hypothetical protein